MISKLPWRSLTFTLKGSTTKAPVTANILNLKYTLLNGQAFNWYSFEEEAPKQKMEDEKETLPEPVEISTIYQGVFKKHFVQFKTNNQGEVNFRAHPENDELLDLFEDYFQFSYNYPDLVKSWKERDSYFSNMFSNVSGIRILKQDPFECLISFICSQNNNIPRITKLIYSLCEKYGDLITEIQGKKYYSFPSLDQLKDVKEQTLRDMGFGYRAKYLVETIKSIDQKGGEKWLLELRGKDHKTIQQELCALMGIGKKVADCIALFSLDCRDVVPIDTHIKQLYNNIYSKSKKNEKETLTDKKYEEIGDFFKAKFGEFAGWAHSYLFTTELREFKEIKKDADKKGETQTKKKVVKKTEEKKVIKDVVVSIKKTEIQETEDGNEKTKEVKVQVKVSRKRKNMTGSDALADEEKQGKEITQNRMVLRKRKQVKKNQ